MKKIELRGKSAYCSSHGAPFHGWPYRVVLDPQEVNKLPEWAQETLRRAYRPQPAGGGDFWVDPGYKVGGKIRFIPDHLPDTINGEARQKIDWEVILSIPPIPGRVIIEG